MRACDSPCASFQKRAAIFDRKNSTSNEKEEFGLGLLENFIYLDQPPFLCQKESEKVFLSCNGDDTNIYAVLI